MACCESNCDTSRSGNELIWALIPTLTPSYQYESNVTTEDKRAVHKNEPWCELIPKLRTKLAIASFRGFLDLFAVRWEGVDTEYVGCALHIARSNLPHRRVTLSKLTKWTLRQGIMWDPLNNQWQPGRSWVEICRLFKGMPLTELLLAPTGNKNTRLENNNGIKGESGNWCQSSI